MKSIWKFDLKVDDEIQVITMPQGAQVLSVGLQNGYPKLWAEVDIEVEHEDRWFLIGLTGQPFADAVTGDRRRLFSPLDADEHRKRLANLLSRTNFVGININMIIYDIEIENAILGSRDVPRPDVNYCAGFHDFPNMGIACIAAYDLATERTRVYLQDNLAEFAQIVGATDCLVGFNNHKFDDRVLAANGIEVAAGKSYDILEEVWKGLGIGTTWRYETHGGLSLDALVYANFRIRKTGSGADAPVDWQQGRRGKVIDYCLADVELTRRLLVKIINCGKLKHPQTGAEFAIRKPSPEAG